jgi:hypothetical protein
MKKTFSTSDLEAMGLPEACEGGAIVSDKLADNNRWSIRHELIFRLPSQPDDEAWLTHYSVGATEQQDERPWEDEDEVDAVLVREVAKLVKVWEPVRTPEEVRHDHLLEIAGWMEDLIGPKPMTRKEIEEGALAKWPDQNAADLSAAFDLANLEKTEGENGEPERWALGIPF